jgi:dipeptidyl aminopeptidase/acylaminoacyl peptidase
MALAFDWRRGKALSEPTLVIEPVSDYSVSGNGVLAYRPETSRRADVPTWFDRQGNRLGGARDPGAYESLALSPDGLNLATGPGDGEIWLRGLVGDKDTRLTVRPREGRNSAPIWAPDGSSLVFSSRDGSGIAQMHQKAASGAGAEEVLLKSAVSVYPNDWSRDGRFLIFSIDTPPEMSLQVLPMGHAGSERTPVRYLPGSRTNKQAQFSHG